MDWTSLSLSLKLGLLTTAILMPLAIAAARVLAWQDFRGKSLIEALIMLPLVLPPTVLGFYLLTALGPATAPGQLFTSIIGVPLAFSFAGILFASVLINVPFAIQPIQRAFEAVPREVREAAWVSGLSPWRTFLKIELPLAWPGIVSGIALVFAHTLGEFGVILMIGGSIPGETQTLALALYDRVQAFRYDEAGFMAATLLVVSLAAIAIVHMTARNGARAASRERP